MISLNDNNAYNQKNQIFSSMISRSYQDKCLLSSVSEIIFFISPRSSIPSVMIAAETTQDMEQRIVRLSDVVNEPLEMLLPISGFQNMPIVPLETAVQPLVYLVPGVENYTYIAKQRCRKSPADDLTTDESASIILYTMGWLSSDKCLYNVFNATLRSVDRERLKPWFLYLKLLFTALHRLPSTRLFVYRGG